MLRSAIQACKWPLWCALAVTIVSLYPQFLMWGVQGREWNGAYAEVNGDEWVYSAYVQALIDGRPRRNDPYTGRDDQPDRPQPESVFSIQFVPAYLIAFPARLLDLSSSTAFIVLEILTAFLSCLALSWFIENMVKDRRLAAAGAVVVLCFGALAAGSGAIHALSSRFQYAFLPFLRRYEPAAMFPLFFVFCGFMWKSLIARNRSTGLFWAVAAGLSFDVLIFSYFYLWTTAAAWLACLAILWFVTRPANLRKDAGSFVAIFLLALAALGPYYVLLSRRSLSMDTGQKLIISHAPDLLRVPEWLGIAVIVVIVVAAIRGKINWRAPESLFAAACSLMPFVVFNQQVITGRSLQPFHYESFIANYVALVGAVVVGAILWREPETAKRKIRSRTIARLVFIAVWWAALEVLTPTRLLNRDNQFIDRAAAVCLRLRTRSSHEGLVGKTSTDPRPLVLVSDNKLAVILPTFAPQAVLWAPHFDFLDLTPAESRERFYEYLYYTGIDGTELKNTLRRPMGPFASAAFGHERVIPDLAVQPKPITDEEIERAVLDYETYVSKFTRETASQHILSYTVVPADGSVNLSNHDRWYERDHGEQVGPYLLYRVQLRP